jgi:hypothetical protein
MIGHAFNASAVNGHPYPLYGASSQEDCRDDDQRYKFTVMQWHGAA